jgi:hypothetical protein
MAFNGSKLLKGPSMLKHAKKVILEGKKPKLCKRRFLK